MKTNIGLFLLLALVLTGCNQFKNIEPKNDTQTTKMTEEQARVIAEKTCIKGGEALASGGSYNPNSKTWWFDANLNATKPGCNPACVVSEENNSAEINWRCTGLLQPEDDNSVTNESTINTITKLFEEKYPDQTGKVVVTISQELSDHARGSVSFAPGEPGGIWLAAKVGGKWQIVHDGNGMISCNLKQQYGFPEEMVSDCAE